MSKLNFWEAQKQNNVFGPFTRVLKKGMLCMCCVQNETKQTKCAKTFQTVWLLCDRGGEHIREKTKEDTTNKDKQRGKTKEYTTKDKQKLLPTLCSWSQTANYKRWIKVKVSRHGARHPGTHSTPHTTCANRVQNCKTLAKCAQIVKGVQRARQHT